LIVNLLISKLFPEGHTFHLHTLSTWITKSSQVI